MKKLFFFDETFYWGRSGKRATVIEVECDLTQNVRPEVMLLIWGCGCILSTMVVLMNFGKYSMIGLMAIFLFEAVMFPTIFSLALRGLGSLTKTASSILMMTPVGGCGFLLVGLIADATNLVIPFVIPLLCYIIVSLFGFGLIVPKKA